MPRRASIFLALAVFLARATTLSYAGDAVFSADGRQIYVIAEGKVEQVDLEAKTIRTFAKIDDPRGIAGTKEGTLFCTTTNAFYSLNPETGALTKIRDAAPGAAFRRVAYDPSTDALFVTTDAEDEPLWRFKPPLEWKSVRMRRHPYPSCLVFTRSGELFFAPYGDLWHGEIQEDEEGNLSLEAYRYVRWQPWRPQIRRLLKSVSPTSA